MFEKIVYTVGHSNGSFEHLLSLLKGHEITAVADVRSHPYSRPNPQFDRDTLSNALRKAGLHYVFLGSELGARVSDSNYHRNGRVQYELLATTDFFRAGINRILKGVETQRIALLCAEKEPLACHRCILIGRHLRALDLPVRHILHDGSLEDHDASINRLVQQLGISDKQLFHDRDDVIAMAYALQSERIAFVPRRVPRPA